MIENLFALEKPKVEPKTVDSIKEIKFAGPWTTKSDAQLIVLFKFGVDQVRDQLDYDESELKYIPEDAATNYRFAPIEFKDGVLEVGITDGGNTQAIDALQFISTKLGIPFKIFLISVSDYKSIMETYKGISVQVEEALDELNQEEVANAKSLNESKNLNKSSFYFYLWQNKKK